MLTAEEANKKTAEYFFTDKLKNIVKSALCTIDDTINKVCTQGKYSAVVGFCFDLDSVTQLDYVKTEISNVLDSLGYKNRWKTESEKIANAVYGVEFVFDNDADSHTVDEIISVSWGCSNIK